MKRERGTRAKKPNKKPHSTDSLEEPAPASDNQTARESPPRKSSDGASPAVSEPAALPANSGPAPTHPGFPVVGLGASAGGLEAFKRFLLAMPPDSGMAFVLIPHLDPAHTSQMADLLSKFTTMPVMEVMDEMPLVPNTVFVIPPNTSLALRHEKLQLAGPVMPRGIPLPIDFFFRSMAVELQNRAICIVLSGTGADGTLGLRAVKEEGGMAIAQDPASADYNGMPQSAIDTGLVDFVLPLEEMPEVLIRYARHTPWLAEAGDASASHNQGDLNEILGLLRARTNHDFRCYKKGTLTRRIHRRMGLRNAVDYAAYLALLHDDEAESAALLQDLMIGVTAFFRDPDAWQHLEQHALLKLLKEKNAAEPIRVWVAGCSTGEEAYSMAILISELQTQLATNHPVQIFASDIDEEALAIARSGLYPESIVTDVGLERLNTYFDHEKNGYRVKKAIREMVICASQNLIADPPFSKLDLVSCRNLLIYLENQPQQKVLSMLHFSLREGGYLFLGPSEAMQQSENLFIPLVKKWRIYRKAGPHRRDLPEFQSMRRYDQRQFQSLAKGLPREPRSGSVTALAQDILLREYVPATVLINRRGEAIYFHGPVSRYLEITSGEPTRNIADMGRHGLRLKLRDAIRRSIRDGCPVTVHVSLESGDSKRPAIIKVRPLDITQAAEGLILISFEEIEESMAEPVMPAAESDPEELLQLEYELTATREDLQSTIEEFEMSNEELKVSNEEVMSMNEELQSANEELETSKEELQSLNEELNTVNFQLQEKLVDLETAHNDVANLFDSTNVATLFLARNFRLRHFTPAATRLFRLIPGDVGRQLEDITARFRYKKMMEDARKVLADLQPVQRTVVSDDQNHFLCRIFPYRTANDKIDGIILTFVDITELEHLQHELAASEERFRNFMNHSPALVWIKDATGRFVYFNQSLETLIRARIADWRDKTDFDLWDAESAREFQQHDRQVLESGKPGLFEETLPLEREGPRIFRNFKFVFTNVAGEKFLGGVGIDITSERRAEDKLACERRRLGDIIEATQVGTWEWNYKTGEVIVNEQWAALVGYTLAELAPVSLETWTRLAHPDDLKTATNRIQLYLDGELPVYECEVRMRHKSGKWVWILARGGVSSRAQDGTPLIMSGTHLDITPRKQAEELSQINENRLKALVEATTDAIYIKDHQGRYVLVNTAAMRLAGRLDAHEWIGKDDKSLYHRAEARKLMKTDRKILAAGAIQSVEEQVTDQSGRQRIISSIKGQIRSETGEIIGLFAIARDVTELIQKEKDLGRELRMLQQQAEAASLAKSSFLANMSHEIRTPLNGILGWTSVLAMESLAPQHKEYLRKIEQCGTHLLSILDDILDISRIESGKLEMVTADFDFAKLIETIRAVVESGIRAKGRTLVIDQGNVPSWLNGDADFLKQALLNYLSNAIKYSDHGAITMRCRMESQDETGCQLRFEVEDGGSGIDEDSMDRLFTAFEQGDNSMTRNHGGVGLGLAITKHLAEAMGGQVGASNRPEGGSVFWLTVRMRHAEPPASSGNLPSPPAEANFSGMKVLLVEDDEICQEVEALILRSKGLEVEVAGNGRAAVEAAKTTTYDLILMDLHMPEMNGLEACREIRALPGYEKVPIIALTACAMDTDARRCLEAGMNGVITKPFKLDNLTGTIAAMLHR